MSYFLIDTLGDLDDPEWCVLDDVPVGIGVAYSRLVKGRAVGSDYPADAEIHMSPGEEGIKVGGLIGSTKSFLIVRRDVKEVIEAACEGAEVEYLPFRLIDHKGRIHSSDYFIINPIGSWNCLDPEASAITYFEDTDKVLRIDRMVIDSALAEPAPMLFRLKQAPTKYVVKQELADRLREKAFENLLLIEMEQVAERE